jgi:hypothetical protein
MDVTEAAAQLGITEAGVRKRLQRGQLHGEKVGGQWFITLPDTARPAPGPLVTPGPVPSRDETRQTGQPVTPPDGLAERVAWLETEHDRLLRVIEQDAVERAELRRLLAELIHQLPQQLPPAPEPAGRAEEPATPPTVAEPVQTTPVSQRGFWARLFGR